MRDARVEKLRVVLACVFYSRVVLAGVFHSCAFMGLHFCSSLELETVNRYCNNVYIYVYSLVAKKHSAKHIKTCVNLTIHYFFAKNMQNKYTGPMKKHIYKCIHLSLPLVQGVILILFG